MTPRTPGTCCARPPASNPRIAKKRLESPICPLPGPFGYPLLLWLTGWEGEPLRRQRGRACPPRGAGGAAPRLGAVSRRRRGARGGAAQRLQCCPPRGACSAQHQFAFARAQACTHLFLLFFIVFSGARSARTIPPALCARVIQVCLWISVIQFSLFPGLLSLFPGLSPFFRVLSTTSP